MTAVFASAAVATVCVLVFVVAYILGKGLHMVTPAFLTQAPRQMGRSGGIYPAIVGSVLVTGIAVLIATPVGVATALYLTEYTREDRLPRIVRFGTESLAGIPSIIFGLFGFLFFVIYLGLGWSVLSGALTLAAMILPTIVRTSEEAIRAVPNAYREISYALGSTRWQTVMGVVLPSALPGIVTGIVLAIGRSIGETAAVIFTAGASLKLPGSLLDPVRTLPVHFYILAREGISMDHAYGTAAVLIVLILVINVAAYSIVNRFAARSR
ncbi:MAG: phosphate ABC transporter permease PstA [Firmicutes bacterium]|jgi:phosphate transport system permease protein|nr:phosphate ABC transporter permease PstA [Bacillota bacterium]MDH7494792.1 phosphate ABC transporter permease PstA [Bacillota bacterium]